MKYEKFGTLSSHVVSLKAQIIAKIIRIIQKVLDVVKNFVEITLDFLWMPSNAPVLTTQMLSKIHYF